MSRLQCQEFTNEMINAFSSLRSLQTLALDFEATLQTAQPWMEKLNSWSSAAAEFQPDLDDEEADFSGPCLLGQHVIRVLLFRAILRPFHDRPCHDQVTTHRNQCGTEAHQHSRSGAKACIAAFTAFTINLNRSCLHAFWPFCT